MVRRSPFSALSLSLACLVLVSCETFGGRRRSYPPPPPPAAPSSPGEPLTPEPPPAEPPPTETASPGVAEPTAEAKSEAEHPLPVARAPLPIVVEAWAEPRRLPPRGGQVQVLVRVQRRDGGRYPGVEVRLSTSKGTLFSDGRVLVTDTQGMTRDRLTASGPATITLTAGGTRYRFHIPVATPPP